MDFGDPSLLPHDNEGPKILAATLTVTIAAFITTVVRLFVRLHMIQSVSWDDYVMVAAMLMCISGQGIIIPEVKHGAGKHAWDIDEPDFKKAYKLNFITQPLYLIAICTVKMSIGFFLLRVAVTPIYRRIIAGVMGFMSFYTFGCFLTVMLQCTNLAVLWDRNAKGTCWGPNTLHALSYTNNALNITTDLLFSVIIPIPMLWHVQMNRRTKGSILAILSLGIFATAACLIKLGFLPNYGKTGDWLWDSRNITIWTVIECNISIVAGNLPCLKPLFRRVLGSTYGRGSARNTGNKYMSRPYGNGTGNGGGTGASKNYNELGSGRRGDDVDYSKEYGTEAVAMTRVTGRQRSSGRTSRDGSTGSDKASEESVSWLAGETSGRMGGITKTTHVNIQRSPSAMDPFDDSIKPEQREAHLV